MPESLAVAISDMISIHAPRMGSDWLTGSSAPHVIVFQSTLPGWGATGRIGTWVWTIIFQSTLPGWGATRVERVFVQ